MMNKLFTLHSSLFTSLLIAAMTLVSCQESMEDRAAREAKEFTEKYCPTPPQNGTITDSIVFDKATGTQTTYVRMTGDIDNAEAIAENEAEIKKVLLDAVKHDTSLKAYKENGFNIQYVCRSDSDPKRVLLSVKFTPKDYQ